MRPGAQPEIVEVVNMRTILSVAIIILASVIGFMMGAGMNEAMGGATLFATIAGFACTIQAIDSKKKR